MALFLLFILIAGLAVFYVILRKKNMHTWIASYIYRRYIVKPQVNDTVHIMFAFVDHYEPQWGKPNSIEIERQRVDRWMRDYPILADKHKDSDGLPPTHGFFYPEEEYREEHLKKITNLCADGYGEIEIHLHHDNDTSDNLRKTLLRFIDTLKTKHDAVPVNKHTQKHEYSFIHGNWCLDNSRADGRWCGVNDEIVILKETGCYADLTLPSAPSDTQTKKVNSIYYATDNPAKPKSHNTGVDVEVGKEASGDLMIIQGPLALNWKKRKLGVMPTIENSDIRASFPPTKDRVDLWVDQHIHVKGKPEWIFIKIHTHGTQDGDMDTLLGKPVDDMYSYLEEKYNDGEKYALHYVSAREMYNIIKAAEAGEKGNPNAYRDYILTKPEYKQTV